MNHAERDVREAVARIESAPYEPEDGQDGVTHTLLYGATLHLMDALIARGTEQHTVLAYLAQDSIHTTPGPPDDERREEFLSGLAETTARAMVQS